MGLNLRAGDARGALDDTDGVFEGFCYVCGIRLTPIGAAIAATNCGTIVRRCRRCAAGAP
jgi:hypothetical protein